MKYSSPEICVDCGEHRIYIKKRSLCLRCYRRRYEKPRRRYKHKLSRPTQVKIQHQAEIEFTKNYESPDDLLYQPTLFRFNGTSYQPDFYDKKKNLFFEIIGASQRFYQSKVKIDEFREAFPLIQLEVIHPNGNKYAPHQAEKHPCPSCRKPVYKHQNYCSKECRQADSYILVTCVNCGLTFRKSKARIARNERDPRYARGRHFCSSKCRDEIVGKEVGEGYGFGIHPEHRYHPGKTAVKPNKSGKPL